MESSGGRGSYIKMGLSLRSWRKDREFFLKSHIILLYNTVNREYFVVKIFSDSQACAKIERGKIHAQY